KSKNLEPSLLEADKETHQEVLVFLEMEASQTVNLPTFTGIDPIGWLATGVFMVWLMKRTKPN
ncbi:hypothetical protein A2U01_0107843, partial [Trifolium medium]|nr:hypothetical protein [Trifolium medium]